MKEKITISLDKKVLKRVRNRRKETGISISRQIEDLIKENLGS